MITIALAKGRLAEETMSLLERLGIDCSEPRSPGRKLVLSDNTGAYRFILVKPSDVPTYVYHGVADIGVAGKDTLMEQNKPIYEVLDLGFGRCKLAIAGKPEMRGRESASGSWRVATKYPQIARRFYGGRGQTIEIIKLNGSVELGPLVGLSNVILDIVESGSTLRANGLEVFEDVCDISARLVVNEVSLKTKQAEIRPLIDRITALTREGEDK
jgi:ATP phosphoribosyltransferase